MTKDTKSKPKTLPNRIVKETFAKNRMSKALSVQKKIGYGRTDRQTDRQIFVFIKWTRADARRPIAPSAIPLSAIPIYAQCMMLAININGVSFKISDICGNPTMGTFNLKLNTEDEE